MRDRLRRSAARREAGWCDNSKRDSAARLKCHRATDECSKRTDERLESLPIECQCCDLPLEPNGLSLQLGATIHDRTDQAPLKLRRLHAVHRKTRESVLLCGLRQFGSHLRFGRTRLFIAKEQDAGAAMLGEVLHKVGSRLCIGCG